MPTNRSSDKRGRAGPPAAIRIVLGFVALVASVVAILLVLTMPGPRRGPGVARGPAAVEAPVNRIVGDRACQECHPIEAGKHRHSGHANTLRPAGVIDLARWLDGRKAADPERPGVEWSYSLRDGRLRVERAEGGRVEGMALDFALGSGRHATTFVSLVPSAAGSPGSREHRLTFYARDRSLGLTPAHKEADHAPGVNPMGRDRGAGETLHCFGCHVTTVSDRDPRRLEAATMRPGVGCERCHGPGESHVEAARRGEKDLTMPFGKVWTADGQMRLCGDCHRHPSQAPPGEIRPDNPTIARFQPVGLMQSACYTKSDGALSCVNCHNPHESASTDRSSYESACLACHKAGERPPCPVSPDRGCIGCHMPTVDAGQGIPYTDHWIRVRKPR